MPIVGFFENVFEFLEPGGPNHLLPGRPLEQSVPIRPPRGVPPGAGFFVVLRGFTGAFVSPDGSLLTDRPLGQFSVNVGVRSGALVCRVRLTDENSDDAVRIIVTAYVVFIT
jgi:hypothetical protein